MAGELGQWLHERVSAPLALAAINDAVESLWMELMQVNLSNFMGGPTSVSVAAASERVEIVSIPTPAAIPFGLPIQITGFGLFLPINISGLSSTQLRRFFIGQTNRFSGTNGALFDGNFTSTNLSNQIEYPNPAGINGNSQVGQIDLIAYTTIALGALLHRNISFGITYITESGSETAISALTEIDMPVNTLIQFYAPLMADGAVGWNLYVGLNSGRMALQNTEPLPFSPGIIIQEPVEGWAIDPALPAAPVVNSTADDIFYIRDLRTTLQNNTQKSYQQSDIASELSRAMRGTIAAASEYQNYAYDFINGNTIEIAPKAGQTFTAQYFFVRKPRRANNDKYLIPFANTIHWAYIRYKALSLYSLTNGEYSSSDRWAKEAEIELDRIKRSLSQQNWGKDNKVRPFRP
jgi:hypothetical protein